MIGVMKTITTELLPDETKRGGDGRRMTSKERRAELLADYAASGLSIAAFARREGLRYPTFASWAKNAPGREVGRVSAGPVRFAEVRLPTAGPAESGLSVALPGGVVLSGADPVALAALARALMATGN